MEAVPPWEHLGDPRSFSTLFSSTPAHDGLWEADGAEDASANDADPAVNRAERLGDGEQHDVGLRGLQQSVVIGVVPRAFWHFPRPLREVGGSLGPRRDAPVLIEMCLSASLRHYRHVWNERRCVTRQVR